MKPSVPLRADERTLAKMMDLFVKGSSEMKRGDVIAILKAFREQGGSWIRLFHGSSKDVQKLKGILKEHFKDE